MKILSLRHMFSSVIFFSDDLFIYLFCGHIKCNNVIWTFNIRFWSLNCKQLYLHIKKAMLLILKTTLFLETKYSKSWIILICLLFKMNFAGFVTVFTFIFNYLYFWVVQEDTGCNLAWNDRFKIKKFYTNSFSTITDLI